MTTTVTVRARAHPASVKITTSKTEGVEGHNLEESERTVSAGQTEVFHIEADNASVTVTQLPAPPEEENPRPLAGEKVPGQGENDKLLGKGGEVNDPRKPPAATPAKGESVTS
jgi:hypothetical protein